MANRSMFRISTTVGYLAIGKPMQRPLRDLAQNIDLDQERPRELRPARAWL